MFGWRKTSVVSRGMTLVELLVVVTILVILVGVVLPLAQPALKGREKREAARQIQSVFAAAQARAIAERNEYGVALVPQAGGNQAVTLKFARIPSPYSGSDANASRVRVNTANNALEFRLANGSPDNNTVQALTKLVEDNDTFQIRFNFRGPVYQAIRDANNFTITNMGDVLAPEADLNLNANGCRYQIFRGPKLSAAAPVDLPLGAFVDLTQSGFGLGVVDPLQPLIVLFGANGKVSRAYQPGTGMSYVSAPLFLLVANGDAPGPQNLAATEGSVWVTLEPRSGTARTTENLGFTNAGNALAEARQSALSGPNMGGR